MPNNVNDNDQCIYEILTILEERDTAVGSGLLSQLLTEKGLVSSHATVGRLLSHMDLKKWTLRQGFKGRVITDEGRTELDRMRSAQERLTYESRFLQALEPKQKEDIIEILVARKAIERELARLAAIRATNAEIADMEAVLPDNILERQPHKQFADHDIIFHKTLAKAAGNQVLSTALDLVRKDELFTPVYDYVRARLGGNLVVDHQQIVQAIKQHDPEKAEQAMAQHVETMIKYVQFYWNSVKK